MSAKRLLVFASGSKDGGGSGFENLVRASRDGRLNANIVAVASNILGGGVVRRANDLGVEFMYTGTELNEGLYRKIVECYQPDFIALSGWLKQTIGLDPRTTFNIHPGPLPRFGGKGMYGHHVHDAVVRAYGQHEVQESAVSMHFVTDGIDEGPVFFTCPVPIEKGDTGATLGARVLKQEHAWQPIVTNLVMSGVIHWDGKDPNSLVGAFQGNCKT